MHDIDLSIQRAKEMARIEKDLGIVSTYFVRLHALYNIYNKRNFKCLRSMLDWGHEIALHYEYELFIGEEKKYAENLLKEKRLLEEILRTRVLGFSVHSGTRLRDLYGIDYIQIFNKKLHNHFEYYAMSPEILQAFKYVSDSNRYWRDGCICNHIGKVPKIYALIHPFWWAKESLPVITLIEEAIRGEVL